MAGRPEHSVVDVDVELLLVDAGQVRLDDERFAGLLDLERGRKGGHLAAAEERVPAEELASERVGVTSGGGLGAGGAECERHCKFLLCREESGWKRHLSCKHTSDARNGLTSWIAVVTSPGRARSRLRS